ncbi:MAG: DUF4160 domain-containing protein [Bacteroidota bacterium]
MSPLIVKFDGIRIWVFGRDHLPPHIHVEYGEDIAVIDIQNGFVIAGHVPNKILRSVTQWLSNPKNKKSAIKKFFELNPQLKKTRRRARRPRAKRSG